MSGIFLPDTKPCGSGLARESGVSFSINLADTTPSRASPLPHWRNFVASDGGIRGPYLEAAMQKVRTDNPGLQATDMELANAILAKNAVASE
ncbi:hypothetical protein ABIA48_003180 [Pseudomonas sp. S30_BP2TU TE3576]